MRIYTRAEWNARPASVPSGIKKKYIIIHHTASGNGVQSEASDLRYQYNCQGWHIAEHNAADILQAFTVFQSGRIVEGRMPWDSNNGAIYNAGGGQYDGVGIECDGTFYGRATMGEVQYKSLAWLCAEIVKRCRIDTSQPRWIFGHQEIYPCRPGDSKSTACPGNLLGQFVTNRKLQLDVLAILGGGTVEEDDVMLYQNHDATFYHGDVWQDKCNYWLHIESPPNEEIRLFLKPHGGKEVPCDPFRIPSSGDWTQDLLNIAKTYKVKGSFRLRAVCSNNAWWSLREDKR